MRVKLLLFFNLLLTVTLSSAARPQRGGQTPAADDPIGIMTARLSLEKYKATIKSLTQFGDRREGTERNRAALDWIESQLRSPAARTPND